MSTSEPSRKLADYLSKVENETGRQIVIEETDDFRVAGMRAAFRKHPSHILVLVRSGRQITDSAVEQSIVHEATHGLLLYKKGYCDPVLRRPASDRDSKSLSLLFTMIDDIVVNRTMHEEGFPPFRPRYLSVVREETKAVREGRDYYQQFSADPLFKDRFMASRYIMAWAFLEYSHLEPVARKTLSKFIRWFAKSYPRQWGIANQVKELILENDVFTPEGHRNIVEAMLKLWRLEDLVQLETI